MNNEEYKEDCYFYCEVQDMNAHIQTCRYYHVLGYCPCEGCRKYIDASKVYKLVKKIVGDDDDKVSRKENND